MKKIFEELNMTYKQFCDIEYSNNDILQYFNFIYPFTTENINGYLSQLEIHDKDILTVCGSGDHVLNLILCGAKNIDTFDINLLTKYYLNLKIAAIKALEYEEFLDFFCYLNYPNKFNYNKNAFSIEKYWKISEYLDKYTKMFWDNLYLEFNNLDIRGNNRLFSCDEYRKEVLLNLNMYLNSINYYKLKSILKENDYKINFYNNNITELPDVLKNNYDLILLSNISQYVIYMYDENHMEKYKLLIERLSKILNTDGKILIGYFYDNYCNMQKCNMNKLFKNNIEYLLFDGVNDFNSDVKLKIPNSVAVYKKKL